MRQRLNGVVKADRWGQMWSVYIGVEIEDARLSIPRLILDCGERQHCSSVDRRVNVSCTVYAMSITCGPMDGSKE